MGRQPGIFVYTVKNDAGFAPNPFHGFCTLACCKPQIRARARVGDWIIGISTVEHGKRLVYAMQISEVLSFPDYFADPRFRAKRPSGDRSGPMREQCGDNCYEPVGAGDFRQLPSFHYDFERRREDDEQKTHDLGGKNVLVAEHFTYFGSNAVVVPSKFEFMMPARYYRSGFSDSERRSILEFVASLPGGVRGEPRDWDPRHPSCSPPRDGCAPKRPRNRRAGTAC